ncbi:hypothetical protein ACDF64_10230 [Agromyces sp. MMS24-JH15]
MRVAITDLAVIVWVVFGTQIAWVGLDQSVQGWAEIVAFWTGFPS